MDTKTFLNSPVTYLFPVTDTKGDKVGLELELEGRNVGLHDVATRGWQRKDEGSLRGESIEYVTNGPKDVAEAKKLVVGLFDKFKDNGVVFNNSIRTSTHVHFNFADKPMKQVINFFSVFTMLEEILQYYSGEDRKGNLFCMSSRDAEGIIGELTKAVEKGDFQNFAGDRYKYAACNLSTLHKFGTVEIRTMRGAETAEQINKWLDILYDLYKYSLTLKSPAELITSLSFIGAEALMRKILSDDNYKEVMSTFPVVRNLHMSLMDGARILQIFAFQFEDAFVAEVKIDEKKINQRLPAAFGGRHYQIFKPDGVVWSVRPIHRGMFFEHGDRDLDDSRIMWDGDRQRFIVLFPDGFVFECPWRRHHAIAGERAPRIEDRRPMPRFNFGDDEEPDWVEAEDVEVEVDRDWD
jgi:hypothetical protein